MPPKPKTQAQAVEEMLTKRGMAKGKAKSVARKITSGKSKKKGE